MMPIAIAANHGQIGGGEVMLLALARAMRDLGRYVMVVGPRDTGTLLSAADAAGITTIGIAGESTRDYLLNLNKWARNEDQILLWCNGLRPAAATVGRKNRVVHLHQSPRGRAAALAVKVARRGALETVVPSESTQRSVPGSHVLPNWTEPLPQADGERHAQRPFTVGFLGRLSTDKGVPLLCEAMSHPNLPNAHLALAGEARFVDDSDAFAVERAIDALGDRASRLGWRSPPEFFNQVDLVVIPSVSPESFGLVAAEAMAARCPFIVSDAGALPEVAGSDYPWMFPAGDADALRDLIERAAAVDWTSQTASSYARWKRLFSPSAGRARLAALLDRIDRAADEQ